MEIRLDETHFTEKENGRMDAYIKKIVSNCIADFLKCKKRGSQIMPISEVESIPDVENEWSNKIEINAEAKPYKIYKYVVYISEPEIYEMLNELSEDEKKYSDALILKEVFKVSNKKISKHMGVTERSIQNYKNKAREIFRKRLKEDR